MTPLFPTTFFSILSANGSPIPLAALETKPGRFELRRKSGANILSIGQALFPTILAARNYAEQRVMADGYLS